MRLFALALIAWASWIPTQAQAYSAVATSANLAWGYCYDLADQASAESCALNYCRQYADDPQTCAIGYSDPTPGLYAFALGDSGWGVGRDTTLSKAKQTALSYCRQYSANCSIAVTWEDQVAAAEAPISGPQTLANPRGSLVLIVTHGSDQENIPDPCHLDRVNAPWGMPGAIDALRGTKLGGKTVVIDPFCTPHKVGTSSTLKVELRKADLEARVTAYRQQGVPAGQIFLVGHSAGGWASLLLKMEQPGLFNAVIALAPAFSGEEADRDAWWWQRRQEYLDRFAAARDLSALIFAFDGDTFEEPGDLEELVMRRDVTFVAVDGDEQQAAGCDAWSHGIPISDCFAPTWGGLVQDYIVDRLP